MTDNFRDLVNSIGTENPSPSFVENLIGQIDEETNPAVVIADRELLTVMWAEQKEAKMSRKNKIIVGLVASGIAAAFALMVMGRGDIPERVDSIGQASTTTIPPAETSTTVEATTTTTTVALEGLPEGVPTSYSGPRMPEYTQNAPAMQIIPGGALFNIAGSISAEDGTILTGQLQVIDLRAVDGGTVECNGIEADGPFTMRSDAVSTGALEIEGVGKMNVRLETGVLVADVDLGTGPPICHYNTGTWKGFAGELDDRFGTFERLLVDGQVTWTFG